MTVGLWRVAGGPRAAAEAPEGGRDARLAAGQPAPGSVSAPGPRLPSPRPRQRPPLAASGPRRRPAVDSVPGLPISASASGTVVPDGRPGSLAPPSSGGPSPQPGGSAPRRFWRWPVSGGAETLVAENKTQGGAVRSPRPSPTRAPSPGSIRFSEAAGSLMAVPGFSPSSAIRQLSDHGRVTAPLCRVLDL